MTTNNTPATVDRGVLQTGESSRYTPEQRAQIRALMGADDVSDGDLDMLATVAQATGLNPMVKEIYLVGRKTKTGGYRGEPERWETKWTIQTGIDGFRKVTHRYAQKLGAPVQISEPVFYAADGSQRPFWSKSMGEHPEAASVTIRVGDNEATATAVWDEYVQKNKAGKPTAMWEKMPSVMLAKCAEAQAHRRICPLTAGIYEESELQQVDSPLQATAVRTDQQAARLQAADFVAEMKQRQIEQQPQPTEDTLANEEIIKQISESISGATTQPEVEEIINALPADLHDEEKEGLRAVARARWDELGGTQ